MSAFRFLNLFVCVVHLQVNSVSAREQLAQSIRDLTAALAERHASLTQALEAARQKRGEALAAQVAERRALMEHAGLMAFTQEMLKETDQPCFVQAARQTHNRFSISSSLAMLYVLMIKTDLRLLLSLFVSLFLFINRFFCRNLPACTRNRVVSLVSVLSVCNSLK